MRENTTNNEFFEENQQQQFNTSTATTTTTVPTMVTQANNNNNNSTGGIKRPHSLDFNAGGTKLGKRKFNQSVQVAPVLESPDIQKFGIATPDLDKFISMTPTGILQTPGVGGPLTFTPSKATIEQEEFVHGFENVLNDVRIKNEANNANVNNNNTSNNIQTTNSNNNNNNTVTIASTTANTMSGGGIVTYADNTMPVATIKEEPQQVSQSPPVSPIDMENQERIKLERKRMRNRVAASKCRKRKLERISKLEDKVKNLKGENAELGSVIAGLKQHVFKLKQQVIEHIKSGCTVNLQSGQF